VTVENELERNTKVVLSGHEGKTLGIVCSSLHYLVWFLYLVVDREKMGGACL